ncbi:MAG TPA: protein-glutamate O-methyltransferase CheR, partial [Gemmatimonadales bacterium]|nr:protein-glutamate O-methyltransferase CheR [Gemmatimonadales bacterium]
MKPVLTDELVGAAAALLARHTGLVFPAARRRALEDALARLSRRIGGAEACVERLAAGDPGLFDQLIADITVGETYFFRHPGQLAAIRELVLPELASRVRGRPIRIWSAGCASGEEAYTLAILALEAGLADRVQITATDLSRLALARAVRGRFGRWSLRSTPDESRTRYFREAGTEFELLPEIRRLVTFAYHNLATDPYPALGNGLFGMDLVLCRNVMIYLDAEVVARVSRQLVATLAPGGWLIAGAADPSIADHAPCEVVIAGCGLLFRRNL